MYHQQIIDIIDILAEIRDAIIDLKSPEESPVDKMENVYRLRDGIIHQLEAKTIWGKNQLTDIISNLVKTLAEDI